MRYKILSAVNKTTSFGEVKDINAVDVAGLQVAGSVWKKQKDGTEFPNYDAIVENAEIELNAWVNPSTGRTSFFAPKPAGTQIQRNPAAKTAQMNAAMDKKAGLIEKAQDNKEQSIKVASTFRAAVDLIIAEKGDGVMTAEAMREGVMRWRQWLWSHWDDPEDYPPFND